MRRSLALLALLVGACVRPLEEAPSPLDPELATYTRSVEVAVHDTRQAQGLRRVVWSDALARSAQRHSQDLARRGTLEHITPDGRDPSARAEAAGVDCQVAVVPGHFRMGVLENLAAVMPTRVSKTSSTGERRTVYRASPQLDFGLFERADLRLRTARADRPFLLSMSGSGTRRWKNSETRFQATGGDIAGLPKGQSPAQEVARETIDGWLNSPGHRRVLLDPSVRLQGIGIAVAADHRVLVTQVLC